MTVSLMRVAGYRSIRKADIELSRITLITGANGSGKSNLHRALLLLASSVIGQLARNIADEGGMPSVLWAGERTKGPVRMTIAARLGEFGYELSVGLPAPSESAFRLDPAIKEERVTFHDGDRNVELLKRDGPCVYVRDSDGRRVLHGSSFRSSESAVSQIREPHLFPELTALRMEVENWRFYHHFPTEPTAPARSPQTGIQTPSLSSDGSDLAAALQTIFEIGNYPSVRKAVDDMIPGADLEVEVDDCCRMAVQLRVPWMRRPLSAAELSDGTLRYLYLLTALHSPRPPAFIALNEPEMSLHPDLLDPLARMIASASTQSQVWVVTHSDQLARGIAASAQCTWARLELVGGETRIREQHS
jgi:predicted ATPase